MANRFGRRQRRRARAAVEALDQENQRLSRILQDVSARHIKDHNRLHHLHELMHEWDSEVSAIFGRHSSLHFEPRSIPIREAHEIGRLPVHREARPIPMDFDGLPDEAISYHVERMIHTMMTLDTEKRFDMSRRMLVRLNYADGQRITDGGYAFSEAMWRDMVENPELRERIIRDVAHRMMQLFVNAVKKERALTP